MGFSGCVGCALIAGGPALAIFCIILARKSFLVLLLLAWYVSGIFPVPVHAGLSQLSAHHAA